ANTFVQLDLFGASSRTSADTSIWDLTKFTKAFEIWVTRLRQDCLQRQRLEPPQERAIIHLILRPQRWIQGAISTEATAQGQH
ncbi:hypothetical protein KAR91_81300, partial [Candidatus Pacearchaeota archaeon]|nr:hypothetical protein [Candidatus Pacearchaeota archaeon]